MDCITPTQPTPIKHGISLTIEGVLDRLQGSYLGQVVEGFQDAAEDPIPEELRSQEERRKAEALKVGSKMDPVVLATIERDAEEAQDLFLEAQSLATLKEIKAAIARRKAEAEAAWKAKMEAQRAASRMNHDDGDYSGGIGSKNSLAVHAVDNDKFTTTTKKPRTRLLVPSRPSQLGLGKKALGSWGTKHLRPIFPVEQDDTAQKITRSQGDLLAEDTLLPKATREIVDPSKDELALSAMTFPRPTTKIVEPSKYKPILSTRPFSRPATMVIESPKNKLALSTMTFPRMTTKVVKSSENDQASFEGGNTWSNNDDSSFLLRGRFLKDYSGAEPTRFIPYSPSEIARELATSGSSREAMIFRAHAHYFDCSISVD